MTSDEKSVSLFKKHLIDQSRICYERGYPVYTEFLSLAELNILRTISGNELYSTFRTYGGYTIAERQMAVFLPDALYLCHDDLINSFPIAILNISICGRRFGNAVSHRDHLGAILGTGVKRSVIGDILLTEMGEAYAFVCAHMADFLKKELTSVGHYPAEVREMTSFDAEAIVKFDTLQLSVASVRLDSLVSAAFHISRTKAVEAIVGGFVFVNGAAVLNTSYRPRENDVISVRQRGKFIFEHELGTSRKKRVFVQIKKYV